MADNAEELEEMNALSAHPKAWNQHELLASIVSRYFLIHSRQGGRFPNFGIQLKREQDDKDQQLEQLNRYLEKLGWMGKLLDDEPFSLIILPVPERQFTSAKTASMFWMLSIITTLLAGSIFIEHSTPASQNRLYHSFIFYVLPLMSILFIANILQKYIAKKHNVRLGPILPIPDPSVLFFYLGIFPKSMLFWPFGILFLPTLPRMDARPWPNRYALGITSITAPIIFFIGGSICFILGLHLTQDFVAISSMSYHIEPPLFLELVSQLSSTTSSQSILAWANPLVYAGVFLLLFSWILLLPIPTLPGGRIMVSRMGIMEARSSSTQTFLLLIFLVFAILFDVFQNFGIWFFILAICLPLIFFYGSDIRSPFVLNETLDLSDQQHRRLGTFLILIFILALPSQTPIALNENWDNQLEMSSTSLELADLNEDGIWASRTHFDFTNPSSVSQRFIISAYMKNPLGQWNLEWDCAGEDEYSHDGEGCGADVRPGYKHRIWLNMTWDSDLIPHSSEVGFVIEIGDETQIIQELIQPNTDVFTDATWVKDENTFEPQWCVEVFATDDLDVYEVRVDHLDIDNLTSDEIRISGELSNSTNITSFDEPLCIRGLDEMMIHIIQPSLVINNQSHQPLLPPVRSFDMIVPEHGWTIFDDQLLNWGAWFEDGGILSLGEFCPIDAIVSVPTRPSQGDWIWNTNIRSIAHIPEITSPQNLTMLVESGSILSLCPQSFNPYPSYQFEVDEGPELVSQWTAGTTRLWSTPWFVGLNGTFMSGQTGMLTLHNPSKDAVPFRLSIAGDGEAWDLPDQLLSNQSMLNMGSHTFNLTPPPSPYSAFWISHDSGEIVFHFTSFR